MSSIIYSLWPLNGYSVYYAAIFGVMKMKTSLTPSRVITENNCALSVEQDGISISSAVDTARLAAKYASQLSSEYHSLIHRHLARVDPKIAGRFHSLITELTTMTDATFENIRYGKK